MIKKTEKVYACGGCGYICNKKPETFPNCPRCGVSGKTYPDKFSESAIWDKLNEFEIRVKKIEPSEFQIKMMKQAGKYLL